MGIDKAFFHFLKPQKSALVVRKLKDYAKYSKSGNFNFS
jgi:hypothetical protein